MATVVSIAPYKFLPAKIGGQKGIALFNKYFGQHQTLVCLTVADNDNSLVENYRAIKVFSSSRSRYFNPFTFFRIRRILKKENASHLLIEHPYFGWLAFLLINFTNCKLIVHSHNIESLRFKSFGKWWWKILWLYEKWIHRVADYNFFIQADDRDYAIDNFQLLPRKCLVVTYGTEIKAPPTDVDRQTAKKVLREKHTIADDEKVFLFVGSFNYKPNIDALKAIDRQICPVLDGRNANYKILICGPGLENYSPTHSKIIIAGFVQSIEPYFLGADVFLNPTLDGGGIKTKLVEALAYDCNAVSTTSGAIGVDPILCNGKLAVVKDSDWAAFAHETVRLSTVHKKISQEYYQHFYWGNSTKKAAELIEN